MHTDDVADLRHVELGRHARRDVLAARRRGEQDVGVTARAHHRQHLSREVFRQSMFERRAVGVEHLAHTGNLGRCLGRARSVVASHEHMDVAAALGRGSDGVEGRAAQAGVVVFGDDECGHVRFSSRS